MRDFVILDLETSGFSTRQGHEPVQVAAIRLDGRSLDEVASVSTHVRLETPDCASPHAMAIHGLSLADLARAPRSAEVVEAVLDAVLRPGERAGDPAAARWVAHNAGFDRRFWDLLLERARAAGGPGARATLRVATTDLHCSLAFLARLAGRGHLALGGDGWSLDALARELDVPPRGAHDALEDVRRVADLFRYAARAPGTARGAARRGGLDRLALLHAESDWAACVANAQGAPALPRRGGTSPTRRATVGRGL